MQQQAFLRNFTPFMKIIFFGLIVVVTLLFTLIFGIALGYIFFGPGMMTELMDMTGNGVLANLSLQKYIQIVSQFGTFIFPAVIFAFLANRRIASYLKMDVFPGLFTMVLAILAFLSLLPFINWLMVVNEQVHLPEFLAGMEDWMRRSEDQAQQLADAFLADTTAKGLIINLFMIGILAAVGEELVFRGIGIRLLDEWMHSKHLAIWISAIAFSALHLQFYGFLPRMVLGVVLGYLFFWSGSLWVPIITHLINNGLGVLIMYFYNKGTISTNLDEFGSTGSWSLIVLSVAVSGGLMVWIFSRENKKRRLPESISFFERDKA
ncbi:MAG: CPBP family intramembrane metalloprotease [Bacteroidales bacterium]|nr:CPBP family intramembrane metalloprotease [Lentimicrobiaceae bacterium]MDD5693972.1 CPBP family intramembrane metalloprotease [Bacteroidales bacterium]